jgi:hypothetical protein
MYKLTLTKKKLILEKISKNEAFLDCHMILIFFINKLNLYKLKIILYKTLIKLIF